VGDAADDLRREDDAREADALVRAYLPGAGACPSSGKYRHATEREALDTLAEVVKRRMRGGGRDGWRTKEPECSAYECRRCGGWHLTSRARRSTPISQPLPRGRRG
jgi:hypothetical protein